MPILNVELSEDAIEFLQKSVASGRYNSHTEVLVEGLEIMREQLDARDHWEREVIVSAHQRLAADPSSVLSLEQVEKTLELRRKQRSTSN